MFEPSLFFKRLILFQGTNIAYDKTFHKGVNVLFGDNGTGKTTILQFLFYAAGGDLPNWRPHAKYCDTVICELRINGESVCTKRRYSDQKSQPMLIFHGRIEDALVAPSTDWKLHSYARPAKSTGKESYSQVLFDAMGMPHVPTSDTNITMHQILRLIYQDQLSPPTKLFRQEKFDGSDLTKQTIAEFLIGIYDPTLYENQLKLRDTEKILLQLAGEQKGLKLALSIFGEDFDVPKILGEQKEALAQTKTLQKQLKKVIESNVSKNKEIDLKAKAYLEKLKKDIDENAKKLISIELELDSGSFQLAESVRFLDALKDNLLAFKQSEETEDLLGAIKFEFCPSCFTPIGKPEDDDQCALCKCDVKDKKGVHRIRWRREMEMQISETEAINDILIDDLTKRQSEYRVLEAFHYKQKEEYLSRKTILASGTEEKIRDISEKLGWWDRQSDLLSQRLEIGAKIDKIIKNIVKHEGLKKTLIAKIDLSIASQQEARRKSYDLLTKILKKLLKKDLLATGFRDATNVSIDFQKEDIYVNGITSFPASSHVYLKNCFGLALLLASLADKSFRFPRLLLLDGIEDKGLSEPRVHHLQELILKQSKKSEIDHQIFFTSQTLSNKLNKKKYVIGGYYADGDHTLELTGI